VAGRAPDELQTFERALRFKRDPEEIRRYSEDVLTLSDIVGKDPEIVEGWAMEDRNWMLVVWRTQMEQAKQSGD
jgi:hypothetical protein